MSCALDVFCVLCKVRDSIRKPCFYLSKNCPKCISHRWSCNRQCPQWFNSTPRPLSPPPPPPASSLPGAPICRHPSVTLHSLKRGEKLKIDHLRAAGSPPLQLASEGIEEGIAAAAIAAERTLAQALLAGFPWSHTKGKSVWERRC